MTSGKKHTDTVQNIASNKERKKPCNPSMQDCSGSQSNPKKKDDFNKFIIITIFTLISSAIGYSVVSRFAWDFGYLFMPDADYRTQSIWSLSILSIVFVIMLLVTYWVFRRNHIQTESI